MMKNNLEKNAEETLRIVAENLASYCYDNQITATNASGYYDYIDSQSYLKPSERYLIPPVN